MKRSKPSRPPIAVAAGFLPVAVAGHDRDIEPHQRADVAIGLAVGAQDFDHLPGGGELAVTCRTRGSLARA